MQAHSLSNTASLPSPLLPPLPEAHPVEPEPSLANGPRGLAHDAGNLLGALALYAGLLRAPGVLRPEHRRYADELRVLAHRSALLLARWQETTGGAPLLPDKAARIHDEDAAASLRSLLPLLERLAAPQARIVLEAPQRLPRFALPVEALERIVVNLVRNAAAAIGAQGRAFRRQGTIRIALSTTAREAVLVIEDDGPGLDDRLAALFLETTPTEPDAAAAHGLGLHIVEELTRGAQRDVRVRPGQGTTFLFHWPLTHPTATTVEVQPAC